MAAKSKRAAQHLGAGWWIRFALLIGLIGYAYVFHVRDWVLYSVLSRERPQAVAGLATAQWDPARICPGTRVQEHLFRTFENPAVHVTRIVWDASRPRYEIEAFGRVEGRTRKPFVVMTLEFDTQNSQVRTTGATVNGESGGVQAAEALLALTC